MTSRIYSGVAPRANPAAFPGSVFSMDARSGANSTDSNLPASMGIFADLTGNGFHLIQPTKTLQPIINTTFSTYPGLQFDGDSTTTANADRLVLNSNAAFNGGSTATIFAVLTPTTLPSVYPNIFGKYDWTAGTGWVIRNTNIDGQFDIQVNGAGTTFSATTYKDKRVCVAVTLNAGVVQTYINGVATTAGTYTVGSGFGNTAQVGVGCRPDNGNSQYTGQVHALAFNSSALSGTDVISIMQTLMRTWGLV